MLRRSVPRFDPGEDRADLSHFSEIMTVDCCQLSALATVYVCCLWHWRGFGSRSLIDAQFIQQLGRKIGHEATYWPIMGQVNDVRRGPSVLVMVRP